MQTVSYAENEGKAEHDRHCRFSSPDSKPALDAVAHSVATPTAVAAMAAAAVAVAAAAAGPSIQPGTTPATVIRQNSHTGIGNSTSAAQSVKKVSRFQVNPVTESGTTVVESMSHPNLVSAAASDPQRANVQAAVSESISSPTLSEIHEAIAGGQQGKMVFRNIGLFIICSSCLFRLCGGSTTADFG